MSPADIALAAQTAGAGEVLLTSVLAEGSWQGFSLDLVLSVARSLTVPLVAHGGAGSLDHISQLMETGLVSGAALGSMTVFQAPGKGVLVSFPRILQFS